MSADVPANPGPVAERAIYGFALWIAAWTAFGVYLVWAFVPFSVLEQFGLCYWPSKYWAIITPIFIAAFILSLPVIDWVVAYCRMKPLDSIDTITDRYAAEQRRINASANESLSEKHPLTTKRLAPIADEDVRIANRFLYLDDNVKLSGEGRF